MASKPAEWAEAMQPIPAKLRPLLAEAMDDPYMNDALQETMSRVREFSSPTTAVLAGVAMNPYAREMIDSELDLTWERELPKNISRQELVVGSGVHASIYCSVRRKMGKPKPVVVDQNNVAGGVFAVSRKPSFYLNSRNRPGKIGLPGTDASLNYFPAGVIQPSDISGSEYQTNADIAFCVRMNLACHAVVYAGEPNKVRPGFRPRAKRTIWATGLGVPNTIGAAGQSPRVLTFEQLMAKMDQPFPLKGMGRTAVIGAGDSGKTAIEALTGQGPSQGWSCASLDWMPPIDWWGCTPPDRNQWEACNRSRYKGIGRLLGTRVNPINNRVTTLAVSYDSVYVNERPYDHVIVCIGYTTEYPFTVMNSKTGVGGRVIAFADGVVPQQQFIVGPAMKLTLQPLETDATSAFNIADSTVGIFRYAQRTAELAVQLT